MEPEPTLEEDFKELRRVISCLGYDCLEGFGSFRAINLINKLARYAVWVENGVEYDNLRLKYSDLSIYHKSRIIKRISHTLNNLKGEYGYQQPKVNILLSELTLRITGMPHNTILEEPFESEQWKFVESFVERCGVKNEHIDVRFTFCVLNADHFGRMDIMKKMYSRPDFMELIGKFYMDDGNVISHSLYMRGCQTQSNNHCGITFETFKLVEALNLKSGCFPSQFQTQINREHTALNDILILTLCSNINDKNMCLYLMNNYSDILEPEWTSVVSVLHLNCSLRPRTLFTIRNGLFILCASMNIDVVDLYSILYDVEDPYVFCTLWNVTKYMHGTDLHAKINNLGILNRIMQDDHKSEVLIRYARLYNIDFGQ